jgi:Family of unknown function (DUF5899)
MAEILLIPGLALLGLYTINAQKKEQEGFELPNTNTPDKNYPDQYPIQNPESDTTITSRLSTINQYDGGSVYTDKYFIGETEFNNPALANKKTRFQSLTGPQTTDYFSHNNMQPFFGSRPYDTHTSNNVNESLLDNMVGQGSQIITKRETAPLFDAKQNLGWANGMPNTAEFVRSRMNVSKSMNNVNPFPQQRVAPGIGLGAGTEGAGGFNSGLLGREQWIDKSVDELRNTTNPKASGLLQLGFEGPAGAYVKNLGSIGSFEKNGPETTFELGLERSVGALSNVKGVGIHGEIVDRFVNRPETDMSYSGIAGPSSNGNNGAQLMDGEYMPSNRIELGAEQLGPVSGANRFHLTNKGDFGLKSAIAYPNNRSTNYEEDYFGIVGQTIGSIMAPIMDVLKPNRKNNVVGTLRPYQNPNAKVVNGYIMNPHDRTPTTNREMEKLYAQNLYTVNAGQYQNSNGYIVANQNPVHNQRDITTQRGNYIGGGSSSTKYGDTNSSHYETTTGVKEIGITQSGFTPGGNMSMFNGDVNVFSDPTRQNMMMNTGDFQNSGKIIGTFAPDTNIIGRSMGGNYLYDGISLDRNTPDTMSDILQKNPYALKPLSQI